MNAIRRIGVPHLGHGQPLLPVGRQAPVEVAALAVHVHVQGVEAGAALGERLGHDVAHRAEQAGHLRRGQPAARPSTVDPAAPQRLVGVDVPDAGRDALVEQDPLDLGLPSPAPVGRRPGRRRPDRGDPSRCARRVPAPRHRRRPGRGRPPQGPRRSAGRRSAARARRRRRSRAPAGASRRGPRGPASAAARSSPDAPRPRCRAAAPRSTAGATGTCPRRDTQAMVRPRSRVGEVPRAGHVPAHRPRVPDLHVVDRPARNPSLESGPDHLDLGKLRHATR